MIPKVSNSQQLAVIVECHSKRPVEFSLSVACFTVSSANYSVLWFDGKQCVAVAAVIIMMVQWDGSFAHLLFFIVLLLLFHLLFESGRRSSACLCLCLLVLDMEMIFVLDFIVSEELTWNQSKCDNRHIKKSRSVCCVVFVCVFA